MPEKGTGSMASTSKCPDAAASKTKKIKCDSYSSDDGSINWKRSSNPVYIERMADRERKAESLRCLDLLDEIQEHVGTFPPSISIKLAVEEHNSLSKPLSTKAASKYVVGGSLGSVVIVTL
jgi:hypothetical protein